MQGVTVPKSLPEVAPARFGFVDNAERINSRACMVCCGLLCALSVGLGANKKSAASTVPRDKNAGSGLSSGVSLIVCKQCVP